MIRIVAAICVLFSTIVSAQEDLKPTGIEGLEKKSWVLMDTTYTVRGERSITIPDERLQGKDINYVAFYVKDALVFVDEIPPYELKYNFGNFTHKARIVAVGVQYRFESPEPQIVEARDGTVDEQTGESREVSNEDTFADEQAVDSAADYTSRGDEITITSPSRDIYTYGVMNISAEVVAPAESIIRVDFFVDGALVGSSEQEPWQIEHDFGRGFNEHSIRAEVIFKDGTRAVDQLVTVPLERSDYFVRTRLVTIDATVVDWRDRIVPDLQQEDFRLWEDGVEQEITHFSIEQRPLRVALVIDISSSMAERDKMSRAITSAQEFLEFLDPERDKAALILFNDQPIKVSGFTNNFIELKALLRKISPQGGTAISDTLSAVAPLFEDEIGRKAIVLVTDGIDQHSNISVTTAVEQVRDADAKIYSIGIYIDDYFTQQQQQAMQEENTRRGKAPDLDPTDARKQRSKFERGQDVRQVLFEGLADATGGAAFFPETLRQLPLMFQRIADELRNSYAIGYVPSNKEQDGEWRDVDIEVNRSGLTVKSKEGYVADK